MTQEQSERPSSVSIPQSVLISLVLAVIACMFGSGVYTGRLSAAQENGVAAFEKFKTEIFTPYQQKTDARILADEVRADADRSTVNGIAAGVAHIQGQLEFIINTMPPNTGSRK